MPFVSAVYGRQHPETQLYDLREMAKQRGYEIVHQYNDAISGAKSKRPGLDALMADARRRKFGVVLVAAFDRVARSVRLPAFAFRLDQVAKGIPKIKNISLHPNTPLRMFGFWEEGRWEMKFWKTPGTKTVWYVALLLVLLLARYSSACAAATPPIVGDTAPDFTLNSQEGTPVSLHDFRGKWVVLYFYPKDFTRGCAIEAHNFQRDISQYKQKNAVILGVSVQSSGSHKDFCAKEGLSFKLLADTNHKVSSVYGSVTNLVVTKLAARHTFLINPEGVIVKEFLDVKPSKHSQEVLAAITQLQQSASSK